MCDCTLKGRAAQSNKRRGDPRPEAARFGRGGAAGSMHPRAGPPGEVTSQWLAARAGHRAALPAVVGAARGRRAVLFVDRRTDPLGGIDPPIASSSTPSRSRVPTNRHDAAADRGGLRRGSSWRTPRISASTPARPGFANFPLPHALIWTRSRSATPSCSRASSVSYRCPQIWSTRRARRRWLSMTESTFHPKSDATPSESPICSA